MKLNLVTGFLLFFLVNICISQVSIVNANLNEFNITPNGLSQITVFNSGSTGNVTVQVNLFNAANNKLVELKSNPVVLKSGNNIFGAHNLTFSSVFFASSPQGNYLKNQHRLPSGSYNHCVRILPMGNIEEGDDYCQSIDAVADEFLYLIDPAHEQQLETSTPVLIWMHNEPFNLLTKGDFFRLTLVELGADQKAADGLISNVPVYVSNYLTKHQLQYPFDAPALESGKRYGWQVQKISNGNILSSTEGWEFSLAERPGPHSQVYVALKTVLDGTIYSVNDDRVFFRFDERYQSSGVNCRIVQSDGKIIEPSLENAMEEGNGESKSAGYNCYELDLKPYGLKKGYYTLEVRNEKNKKYLLKLYVD
jgi:hypothetical protein